MIQGNQFEIFLGISWECGSSFHLTCFSGRISGIKCLDEVFHRSRAAVVIIYGNVVRRICNTNFTKQIPILSNEQTPDSGRLSTKNPCFSKEYPWTGWIYPVFTITCFTNFMWPLGVVPRCRPRLWRDIPDEMLGHVRDSKKTGGTGGFLRQPKTCYNFYFWSFSKQVSLTRFHDLVWIDVIG